MPPYAPPSSHYCEINAFYSQSDNLKIIGPGGHNFKRLTTKMNIDYLWWNIERNVFEIWGTESKVESSVKYLNAYIQRFYDNHCKNDTKIDVVIIEERPSKRLKIS